ncbi:hypothetical protein FE783_16040 [Paenibacillus mesophilus]|uniref:hypothetical protein n=1 Tax=Paenibacillus mesophilus TaxID=2582849 RepID=UPI00110F0EF3|nr:hypothetical protein [Paenibacillus mesophilus]TMV48572.1 hypothetical protein FE783_16040 [Paenibacillus mesophilus]
MEGFPISNDKLEHVEEALESEHRRESDTQVSRRKLLTAFGMAGAALAAGSVLKGTLSVYGNEKTTVTGSVYDQYSGNGMNMRRSSGLRALTGLATVDTIDDLRDLTGMNNGDAAIITATGRAGLFRWDSGDRSSEAAADTQSGIYVAPTGQNGTGGAWIRVIDDGVILPQYFGFQEGMGTSNLAALQGAMNAAAVMGAELFVPAGTYYGNLTTQPSFYDYVVTDLPSNLKLVGTPNTRFVNFIFRARLPRKENIHLSTFQFGHDSIMTTSYYHFDINVKNLRVEHVTHFDSTGSVSPWIFIREGQTDAEPSEHNWFVNCVYRDRTNIHVWSAKHIYFVNCDLKNKVREDGIVIKTRKGRGPSHDVHVIGGTFDATTGPMSIGTELGEDVYNCSAGGCTLIRPGYVALLKPNNSVTSDPQYRGGNIRDINYHDIQLEDVNGEEWLCLTQIRVSGGSVVERVAFSNIRGVVRARSGAADWPLLLFAQVNNGSTGAIRDITFDGVSLIDRYPGALAPGNTDIHNETASGYAVASLVYADSYTRSANALSNIIVRNGYFSGVSRNGIDCSLPIQWSDITLANSLFSTLSPRGLVRIGKGKDVLADGVRIVNCLEPARLVQRDTSGTGTYEGVQLPMNRPVRVPALTGVDVPLYVFEKITVIIRITAALDSAVTGNASNYAQWKYAIRRQDGSVVELHAPDQRRAASAGASLGERIVTWDATNAPTPTNQLIYAKPGDVLLVSKVDVGTGGDIPSGTYVVAGIELEH